jgi:hypothetical protein
METVDQRFRLSIRMLMIAIAACALMLTPIGRLVREKALHKAWLLRAEAARMRAIALEERFRAEQRARAHAEKRASAAMTTTPAEGIHGTERGLWAALTVNHAVFRQGQTKDLNIEFTLVNDGDMVLDPEIAGSRIIINEKELPDSALILGNGPRDVRFDALPPGEHLQFGYPLGSYFEQPGTYRVSWRGTSFRSPVLVFRVLPVKTP